MTLETSSQPTTESTGPTPDNLAPRPPKHSGVDRFDEATTTTPVRAWVGLGACLLLVLGVVVWSLTARIHLTVEGQAVALVNGSVSRVVMPADGTVTEILVEEGDIVAAGDTLVTAEGIDGAELALTAPIDGRVISSPERVGLHLPLDEPVLTLEATEGERQLRMFIAPADAEQVEVGTPAVISFPGQGPVPGRVASVGGLPLTHEEIERDLGSAALARMLTDLEAGLDVVVVADDPADLPDGEGLGRFATVTLVLDSVPPIQFVL